MPKHIHIEPHLDLEELQRRYREAKDPVERSHYHIIWLLAQGRTTKEVSHITGYSRSWIYELVWGYNNTGPDSLGDKRHEHKGKDPLLNKIQQAQLWEVLQSPPAEGGSWNGRKVADWMSEILGRPISRQRGWEYLQQIRSQRLEDIKTQSIKPNKPPTSQTSPGRLSRRRRESSQIKENSHTK